MDFVKLELLNLAGLIRLVFGYLFPEYPSIGIVVAGVSFFCFVFYIFKSGFLPALKVGLIVFLVLTCFLVILHHMAKILHVSLMF